MDDKRQIDINKISEGGYLISKIGRFSIVLTRDGAYKVVDSSTGNVIADMTKQDVDDLYHTCIDVKRWGNAHNIIK